LTVLSGKRFQNAVELSLLLFKRLPRYGFAKGNKLFVRGKGRFHDCRNLLSGGLKYGTRGIVAYRFFSYKREYNAGAQTRFGWQAGWKILSLGL